jgi:hypothetical protein
VPPMRIHEGRERGREGEGERKEGEGGRERID